MRLLIACSLTLLAPVVLGPALLLAQVSCGDIIGPGQTVVLTGDVGPCPMSVDPAVTVVGPATFDLAGHRVLCDENNPRPIGMFMLLTIVSLTLGFVTMTTSVPLAIGLIGLSTFIGGGFQMVALKVGSYAFPREQSALMSGIASGSWSLVNFILLNAIGAGVSIAGVRILPGGNLIGTQRWEEIFWIIALMPLAGVAVWMVLSRNQTTARA